MQKGAAVFEGYRNIGWRPWEPVVFPKAWWPYAFELVDEVWASSQFLFDMYKQATDKPVKLVPLAVSVERMKPYPRRHYGLPEGKFLFLYIFDFNSTVACKNLMAAVQALFAFSPTKAPVSPQHEAFRIVTEVRCHCLEVREDGMLGAEEQMLPITFLFQKA